MSKNIKKSWRAENTVMFLRRHGLRLFVFGGVFVVAVVLGSMYFAASRQSSENAAIAFINAGTADEFSALSSAHRAGAYAAAAAFAYGRELYDDGDYDKASGVFAHFAQTQKGHFLAARAIAGVGYCLERKGDFAGAAKQFGLANAAETDAAWKQDNLLAIARCTEQAGDKTAAIALYKSFLELYPDSVWSDSAQYRISLLNRK